LKQAYAQGNDALGLELGAQIISISPDDLVALKIMARIHNRQRNWPAAKELWSRINVLDGDNVEALLQLARIANREKQLPQALTLLRKLLLISPGHEEALVTSLKIAVAQDDMAEAVSGIRLLVQHGIFGTTDLSLTVARQLFEKYQAYGDALEVSGLIAQQDPENTEAVKLRAKILANLQTDAIAAQLEGDVDAAAQACRDILRSLPQHERASSILRSLIRPLLVEARALYKSVDAFKAVAAFNAVLALDPNQPESLRSLARIYGRLGEEKNAAEFWGRLEKVAADDLEPKVQLARLMAKDGNREGALIAYSGLARVPGVYNEEAVVKRDRMAALVLRSAAIKARDLELDEALRLSNLVAAIEQPPDSLIDVRSRIELLSVREAAHAFKAQDNIGAVCHSKRALAVNPANERALMILARAGHKTLDYRAALAAWQQLSELQPTNLEAWLQQARYHLRFREYDAALSAAKRLQALDSTHDEAAVIAETATIKMAAR
jgi:tetratricopeptide (TPR) repeat protein